MCAFCLPASLSASEFQGAGRQKPRFSNHVRDPRERERERERDGGAPTTVVSL
jgi:hypothetical protein